MKLLAFLPALLLLSPYSAAAQAPIKIAVIDSGFGFEMRGGEAHLCKFGHKDFSADSQFIISKKVAVKIPKDIGGHGTNIVGIIDSYLKKTKLDYCIVVIKYYSVAQTGSQNLAASIASIRYAANLKVDYINYSGGGAEFSSEESRAVKRYLDQGGRFIAAAGNEYSNLDLKSFYPAMYDSRIIVVGNINKDGVRLESSNYGSVVKRWEVGENVNAYGIILTGTSQATARATGKIVSESKRGTRN